MAGPGTILARWLASYSIRYEEPGCNCYKTMVSMDRAGAQQILDNLDLWTDRVKTSSHSWYKSHKDNKTGQLMRIGIKPFENLAIRHAIKRACEESLKE